MPNFVFYIGQLTLIALLLPLAGFTVLLFLLLLFLCVQTCNCLAPASTLTSTL
jgi:hypothetical protein